MVFLKSTVESFYIVIPRKSAHAGYGVSFSEKLAAFSHSVSCKELIGGAACFFFKFPDKMFRSIAELPGCI